MPDNPYLFGNPETDRLRLETQSRLLSERLRQNAPHFIQGPVTRILDLGCGDDQLGRVLCKLYPAAHLLGVDKDEKAIRTAQARAQEQGLTTAEYRVGDVNEPLPEGPFDLVFASLILLHTRRPDEIVQQAYAVLRPGGTLWIIDLDPSFKTAYKHPAYLRLAELLFATLATIGAHPYIGNELPGWLKAAGFTGIRKKVEHFSLGGTAPDSQATLATLLGGFYNARQAMSATQGVPESEIIQLYVELANAAMSSSAEVGKMPSLNVVAHRPA